MVDAIGWKAARAISTVAPVAAPAPAAAVAAATAPTAGNAAPKTANAAPVTAPTTIARTMAAEPPVDADRVSRIKAAIATGKFPILPSTIADRLLALKLDWNPNAKA